MADIEIENVTPTGTWDFSGGTVIGDNDTTYVSSDFTHDDLTGYVANEHIDWTNATESISTTGDITGTIIYGDGSNLTGVGAAAATALTILCKAAENIDKGEIVYVSGVTGNMPQVSLADNTDAAKHWVCGMAAETKTSGQNILIRVRGEVTSINTNAFEAGDVIYLSTGGAMVNTAPTSGAIETLGYVTVKAINTGEVVLMHHSPHNITAPSGDDTIVRMGDSVGANKCYFKDYANNEVAAIDSDGNITTSGTVDGIDIATDVANNTTHRGLTNPHIDWTADQGATNIHAGNYTDTTYTAGDFAHNSLSGLNDGDSYEHITQTQKDALHTQNTDTALGSGAVAADHGTAATDQIINVCYGTGDPPTANTTTIGTLFVKYTA